MEGHEFDSFFGKPSKRSRSGRSSTRSIHDVFFPPKLPPLVLTSTADSGVGPDGCEGESLGRWDIEFREPCDSGGGDLAGNHVLFIQR